MDAVKILEMQIKVQMDDLKDAEMLAEYAEQAKELGDDAVYQKFIARAKTRMQQFENCSAEVENQLVKIKAEEPDCNTDELMHEVYKNYFDEWKDKVKSKLLSM